MHVSIAVYLRPRIGFVLKVAIRIAVTVVYKVIPWITQDGSLHSQQINSHVVQNNISLSFFE